MSTKSKAPYNGCALERRKSGKLRLRFYVLVDGVRQHVGRDTGLDDTAEGRKAGERLRVAIGAAIRGGRTLAEIDMILSGGERPKPIIKGVTVAEYYERWIDVQNATLRKGQRTDYRRHIRNYVLPILGPLPMADLKLTDIRSLQAELLSPRPGKKKLGVKYVKNIIGSSLRAMVRDARAEDVIAKDPYGVKLRWPRYDSAEADPFTADERERIIEYFRAHQFRKPMGPGRWRPMRHPPYHVLIDVLFWSGLRPSEATGLQQGDVDIKARTLRVRRSRYLRELNAPKTRGARRTVELFPRLAKEIADILPLHMDPEAPLFVNTDGNAADSGTFKKAWYTALRSLEIRQRGIYCTKDTFVTTALSDAKVSMRWIEQQTGEDYRTLKRHYSKWMPQEAESELRRFESIDPSLFGKNNCPPSKAMGQGSRVSGCDNEGK